MAIRNWYDQPYLSSSFWNTGIGSAAVWGLASDADVTKLRTLTGLLAAFSRGQPLFIGAGTDMQVTITNTLQPAAMSPQIMQVPVGAAPGNVNRTMNFFDVTHPGRLVSCSNCTVNNADANGAVTTSTTGITCDLSAAMNAFSDGIQVFDSNAPTIAAGYDFFTGTINDYDMANGVILHMLRIALSPDVLRAPGASMPWPNFQPPANAATTFVGVIPAGTFGIPASINVASIGLSTGGLMLANALQKYGAVFREVVGTSNQLTFFTTPENENNSLIRQMRDDLPVIIPFLNILRNQSTNGTDGRINGGGSYPGLQPEVTGGLPGAGLADELYYHNHSVYVHLTTGWKVWQSATQSFVASNSPLISTSVDGSTLNSTSGTLYDNSVPPVPFSLVQSSSSGLQVSRNAVVDTTTSQAVLLLWFGGKMHYSNSQGAWFFYDITKQTNPWTVEAGDPRISGQATVTDIFLSNASITAALPAGTVVGNITVQMSTGSFTGTINPVGGASATSFSVLNNNLVTSGPLVVGAYPITLSTLLNGTTFSKNFTITVVAATQSVSISVAVPTGKILTQDSFGASTGADARNSFAQLMNTSAITTNLATIKFGSIRFSAAELVAMRYATGTTTIMNNWWNTLQAQILLPGSDLTMGVGGPQTGDNGATPTQHAAWVTSFANAMKAQGHEIFRWEIGNEQDVLGMSNYVSYYNVIADALLAINPLYLIGGPVTAKYGAFDTKQFVAAVTPRRLGFLSFHSFDFPINPIDHAATYNFALNTVPPQQTTTNFPFITPGVGSFVDSIGQTWSIDTAGNVLVNGTAVPGGNGTGAMEYVAPTVYAQDLATGNWYTSSATGFTGPVAAPPPPTATVTASPLSARTDLAGTGADSIPIMMAGNLGPLATGAALNTSFSGMVGLALLISKYFKNDPLGKFWFNLADLYYTGPSQFTGDISEITPQGHYIHAAAIRMLGNQVTVTNNLTNVDILATVSGKNFAIQLINYDLSAVKVASIGIVGGIVTGTINRWEMGKSSAAVPIIGTQASVSSVSLPSETVVILTGVLQ